MKFILLLTTLFFRLPADFAWFYKLRSYSFIISCTAVSVICHLDGSVFYYPGIIFSILLILTNVCYIFRAGLPAEDTALIALLIAVFLQVCCSRRNIITLCSIPPCTSVHPEFSPSALTCIAKMCLQNNY